jgi:hypothetical protein
MHLNIFFDKTPNSNTRKINYKKIKEKHKSRKKNK